MKSFVFWLSFPWNLFLMVQLISLDNGLAPNRRQAIIWTNVERIHWRIYAAQGGDKLIYQICQLVMFPYDMGPWPIDISGILTA